MHLTTKNLLIIMKLIFIFLCIKYILSINHHLLASNMWLLMIYIKQSDFNWYFHLKNFSQEKFSTFRKKTLCAVAIFFLLGTKLCVNKILLKKNSLGVAQKKFEHPQHIFISQPLIFFISNFLYWSKGIHSQLFTA